MPEEKASKLKVKKPLVKAKTFTFTLSLPAMISAVGSGVLALSFFFVMGILIGRGYRPEADVPRLNELMPAKEHGQLAADAAEKPEILKPEELGYPDRLKAQPENPAAEPRPAPKPEPAAPSATTRPAAEPAAKAAPAPVAATPASGEPVYDYVYQAAAFRKAAMAEGLADKLAAAGLRANVASGDVKGATWYRVQVLHHGTPASTDAMKAVLAKFGVKRPLLKKKTPVR